MKNKAKRIKNGHYMYRGFELKRQSEVFPSWYAYENGVKVWSCWSLQRIKYQIDLLILRRENS